MLIRISKGAAQTEKMFLVRKRSFEELMSAREPQAKVRVAKERPMMVRYWKCQP